MAVESGKKGVSMVDMKDYAIWLDDFKKAEDENKFIEESLNENPFVGALDPSEQRECALYYLREDAKSWNYVEGERYIRFVLWLASKADERKSDIYLRALIEEYPRDLIKKVRDYDHIELCRLVRKEKREAEQKKIEEQKAMKEKEESLIYVESFMAPEGSFFVKYGSIWPALYVVVLRGGDGKFYHYPLREEFYFDWYTPDYQLHEYFKEQGCPKLHRRLTCGLFIDLSLSSEFAFKELVQTSRGKILSGLIKSTKEVYDFFKYNEQSLHALKNDGTLSSDWQKMYLNKNGGIAKRCLHKRKDGEI